jgi:hypothetical protein
LHHAPDYEKLRSLGRQDQTVMKKTHHNLSGQHSRRMTCAGAGAGSRDAAVMAVSGAVVVLASTLFTTKQINPRWVSGGLPREEIS